MRHAARAKSNARQQISSVVNYPAPIGGLNARDSIAAMKETDALVLDNWFPRTSYLEIRGGSTSHSTGMAGQSKTLVVYNSLTGSNKMFCATTSGVYDISSAGAVGASVAARTNGKHQWTMFGDGTSQWLIMVNGTDKPLYYDGTTWTAVDNVSVPALTGATTSTLVGVAIHKGRLMFIQNSTLAFWYLASGVAGGALTKFDLSGVAQKGGYLMAIASWTVDSGTGADDRLVFITSEGELIVYQGTNPSSATTWALVGVYTIGKPLGRRCTVKAGADMIVLTQEGAYSLAGIFNGGGVNYSSAVSAKIEKLFNEAAMAYGSNFGWKPIVYADQAALIVNVPIVEDGEHIQYVMNTISKSWCKFNGWNAEDFAVFNGGLYFCQGTTVTHAWTGVSDLGSNITAYAKSAFSYFGKQSQLKQFKMFRPILLVNGSIGFLVDIDIDFEDNPITGSASYTVVSQAVWDTSIWDSSYWAAGMQIVKQWTSTRQWLGYSASGKISISTKTLTVQWMSSDYIFESGGIL